jgi:hypothetical protein
VDLLRILAAKIVRRTVFSTFEKLEFRIYPRVDFRGIIIGVNNFIEISTSLRSSWDFFEIRRIKNIFLQFETEHPNMIPTVSVVTVLNSRNVQKRIELSFFTQDEIDMSQVGALPHSRIEVFEGYSYDNWLRAQHYHRSQRSA